MNWTPGPARCRSDEYEAEIAYTDMPGLRPFRGRVRQKGFSWMPADWTSDGRIYTDVECGRDLMPTTITREEMAAEVCRAHNNGRIESAGHRPDCRSRLCACGSDWCGEGTYRNGHYFKFGPCDCGYLELTEN